MKVLFLLAIAVMFVKNVSCQDDTTLVPVSAYWNAGDVWQFQVTKVKQTRQGKNLVQDDSISYRARFEVAFADTDSYTIYWILPNMFFDSYRLPDSSRQKFALYKSISVVYKTDKYGAFTGIENWKELGNMLSDLIQETLKLKTDTSKRMEELRNTLKPMLTVYNTRRGIEQLVFNELLMFHFPLGKQYTVGKTYEYTEQIPVMRNIEPVTGNGTLIISKNDRNSHRCELVQRMKILPEQAKRMLYEYFTQIGVRRELVGQHIAVSVLKVSDDNIFDYLYYPGIPEKIQVSRETLIDLPDEHVRQIDRTTIEKLP